uniref:Uncharacterized protein n=1 Tax=Ditylenchus dipsaci TaxID=166011 RepID=A0A915EJK8_9BILA
MLPQSPMYIQTCPKCDVPDFHHKLLSDPKLLAAVTKSYDGQCRERNLVFLAQELGPKNYRKLYEKLLMVTNVCVHNEKYMQTCRNYEIIIDTAQKFKNCWGVASHWEERIYLNPKCFERPLYLITTMLHEIKHVVAKAQETDKALRGTAEQDRTDYPKIKRVDSCHSGHWLEGIDELRDSFGIFITAGNMSILEGYEKHLAKWKTQADLFLSKGSALSTVGLKTIAVMAGSSLFKLVELRYRKRQIKKKQAKKVKQEKHVERTRLMFERLDSIKKTPL